MAVHLSVKSRSRGGALAFTVVLDKPFGSAFSMVERLRGERQA